jgi:hypothetical protein
LLQLKLKTFPKGKPGVYNSKVSALLTLSNYSQLFFFFFFFGFGFGVEETTEKMGAPLSLYFSYVRLYL